MLEKKRKNTYWDKKRKEMLHLNVWSSTWGPQQDTSHRAQSLAKQNSSWNWLQPTVNLNYNLGLSFAFEINGYLNFPNRTNNSHQAFQSSSTVAPAGVKAKFFPPRMQLTSGIFSFISSESAASLTWRRSTGRRGRRPTELAPRLLSSSTNVPYPYQKNKKKSFQFHLWVLTT